ncbi:MAG: hypothetical protein ACE5PT_02620 [Gemmatimonadales bacterium]
MMKPNWKRSFFTGACALGVVACGLAGGGGGATAGGYEEFATEGGRELTLTVINQNFYDATITAVWPSYNERIGRVGGNTTQTFTLRWQPSSLRMRIGLQSVGTYTTDAMEVDPGDELELVIDPALDKRIRIRRRSGIP